MKLYATTTSERGKLVSKGGNERIDIEVINEKRELVFVANISIDANGKLEIYASTMGQGEDNQCIDFGQEESPEPLTWKDIDTELKSRGTSLKGLIDEHRKNKCNGEHKTINTLFDCGDCKYLFDGKSKTKECNYVSEDSNECLTHNIEH